MAKGDDIQIRLIDFAAAIIKICEFFPSNIAGRHLVRQLIKSGTSPAPNYGEARGAESRNDFIHKLKIALKELNETEVWLLIAVKSGMIELEKIKANLAECKELSRILNASINTAKMK